jgi:hypothetical protein
MRIGDPDPDPHHGDSDTDPHPWFVSIKTNFVSIRSKPQLHSKKLDLDPIEYCTCIMLAVYQNVHIFGWIMLSFFVRN